MTCLSHRDIDDLRFYFRSYAGRIGMRSSHSALVAAMNGVHHTFSPESADPYANVLDDITRGKRVYRVLKRMVDNGDSLSVTVLNLIYGEPHPNAPYSDFGKGATELAPLARFTQAAEDARRDMVGEATMGQEEAVATNVRAHRSTKENDARKAAARRVAIEEELRQIAADRKDEIARGIKDPPSEAAEAWAASLRDEKARWSAVEREATESAFADPNEYNAVHRVAAGVSAEISTSDAVESRLTYRGKMESKGKPDKAEHAVWEVSRDVFVGSMKAEASRLKDAACSAYLAAKVAK